MAYERAAVIISTNQSTVSRQISTNERARKRKTSEGYLQVVWQDGDTESSRLRRRRWRGKIAGARPASLYNWVIPLLICFKESSERISFTFQSSFLKTLLLLIGSNQTINKVLISIFIAVDIIFSTSASILSTQTFAVSHFITTLYFVSETLHWP